MGESLIINDKLVPLGYAVVTLCCIGLLVIWTSYKHRTRTAWFLMFIIVWVFGFPVLILQIAGDVSWSSINWSEFLTNAWQHAAIEREVLLAPLDFLIMLVALLLPLRAFFAPRTAAVQSERSARQ